MNKEFMIIDNIPVAINGEKNLLELIRKAGIELPTFCYYSELTDTVTQHLYFKSLYCIVQ